LVLSHGGGVSFPPCYDRADRLGAGAILTTTSLRRGNGVARSQIGSPGLLRWPALGQVLFQFLQELRATQGSQ
jgi:hypothetical protein